MSKECESCGRGGVKDGSDSVFSLEVPFGPPRPHSSFTPMWTGCLPNGDVFAAELGASTRDRAPLNGSTEARCHLAMVSRVRFVTRPSHRFYQEVAACMRSNRQTIVKEECG